VTTNHQTHPQAGRVNELARTLKGEQMATSGTATTDAGSLQPVTESPPRRTVAAYPSYAGAERAVDWLSDQGFAVEHLAIVGKGLRSLEQVQSRMTGGRAALIGVGQGALIGVLFALLFGIFFSGPDFAGLLAYSVIVGGVFGALWGAIAYEAGSGGGQRDFVSDTGIVAERYEVQADEGVADEAKRLLAAMPDRS
jgi:heat induced stress protein YflT